MGESIPKDFADPSIYPAVPEDKRKMVVDILENKVDLIKYNAERLAQAAYSENDELEAVKFGIRRVIDKLLASSLPKKKEIFYKRWFSDGKHHHEIPTGIFQDYILKYSEDIFQMDSFIKKSKKDNIAYLIKDGIYAIFVKNGVSARRCSKMAINLARIHEEMRFWNSTRTKTPADNNSNYRKHYYAQDGEDALLDAFYADRPDYKGFYVDIGAHHPLRFSNTQIFYEKGWRGINIDATPGSMGKFKELRPLDINIEAGISDSSGEMEYFSFEESALNSFCREISNERINNGWKLKEIVKIKTCSINSILEEYTPENQLIDFISMDIEGLELSVIATLNFDKFAPRFFLIEELDFVRKNFVDYHQSSVYRFLHNKGYIVVAKTMRTVIFEKTSNG
jgi:FkbM family methyltransferase